MGALSTALTPESCRRFILPHRALQEVLSETGQEVPGWLANIAARHAPYGTKSRRGGGRFGGRDFRKDFGGHSNYSHQRHGGYSGGAGGGGYGGGGYGGGGYGGK